MKLEVILSPGEFADLQRRDLSNTVCVVFDILRATTSMIAALAAGATAIVPVAEISEALALRQTQPDILLAGERLGVRILAAQTGGIDFDLGNSPREFTPTRVAGKTIAMTTTNGTRALRASAAAKAVLVSSFLNLQATINWLAENAPEELTLVCSGTHEEPALEDVLAAAAVCEALWSLYIAGHISDSAEIARSLMPRFELPLVDAMRHACNGRRLLESAEYRDDVVFSAQRDTLSFLATMDSDGRVRKVADNRTVYNRAPSNPVSGEHE